MMLMNSDKNIVAERICPEDGSIMTRGVRPVTYTFKDQSVTVDQPGWYCNKCEEGFVEGADGKIYDRALHLLKARHEGLLEPEAIRKIRKKLRLSQEAAGLLIGGGPRAFQKYEAGDLLPSKALSHLLSVLDQLPQALNILKTKKNDDRLQAN